jgi:cytochrome c heme-lyase
MVRKNKAEGAKEEDMDIVVAIHNNMNESTWQAVLAWEGLHEPPKEIDPEDAKPRLLRFTGRPDEHSPKVFASIHMHIYILM